MVHWSPSGIIREAEELLKTARFGLEDMRQRPDRMQSGLRNAIVFGRMVTFALQKLRSAVPDFDAWYVPQQDAMRADPVMSYFKRLRNEIEKEAKKLPVAAIMSIDSFSYADPKRFYPPPPNATALIIGDQNGGSGWLVNTEGGRQMFYVDLPPDIGRSKVILTDMPPVQGMENASAADLAEKYLDDLALLVRSARERFITAGSSDSSTPGIQTDTRDANWRSGF